MRGTTRRPPATFSVHLLDQSVLYRSIFLTNLYFLSPSTRPICTFSDHLLDQYAWGPGCREVVGERHDEAPARDFLEAGPVGPVSRHQGDHLRLQKGDSIFVYKYVW